MTGAADRLAGTAEVEVCEAFESIQGESTYAGLSCFFIRLAGCNLRCRYCDTTQAYGPGRLAPVAELAAQAAASRCAISEVTGGEPLLQAETPALLAAVAAATGRPVLVETNGSCDIGRVPAGIVAVMDIKCPGSGMADRMDWGNVLRLRPQDEVKCVIRDRADYEWAREKVRQYDLASRCHAILFSPVWNEPAARGLASWILADGLSVRFQLQLHKVAGFR